MMSASEPGRRRILLVEPYPAVSRGLTAWLTRQAQLEVIGVAATRDECLQWLHRPHPDLIIMEPAIRDCDGLKLVWLFSKFHHQTPILVFSVLDEKEYALGSLRSGACEFLPKSASPEKLLSTVKTVLSGQARSDPVASGNARTFRGTPGPAVGSRIGTLSIPRQGLHNPAYCRSDALERIYRACLSTPDQKKAAPGRPVPLDAAGRSVGKSSQLIPSPRREPNPSYSPGG